MRVVDRDQTIGANTWRIHECTILSDTSHSVAFMLDTPDGFNGMCHVDSILIDVVSSGRIPPFDSNSKQSRFEATIAKTKKM